MRVAVFALASTAVLVLPGQSGLTSGTSNSISTVDSSKFAGTDSSVALDALGRPVVSYYDGNLKIAHCSDVNCAGDDESITSPDTMGPIANHAGPYTSLALDSSGNPIVSYYDGTNDDLKILHCDDPDCAPSGDSITAPDTAGDVGAGVSLRLDAAGNPVVAYYDATNGDLKIMHCNDVNCAGVDESITSPDTVGDVGQTMSLRLDASGDPVVSYYDVTLGDLKLLHCDDPDCAGGGESITSPDTVGTVGQWTSLALDAAGNPIVSYFDGTLGNLKVLHCIDVNCLLPGSITSPNGGGGNGIASSLQLDGAGNPVIAYWAFHDLRIMHCNDVNCAGQNESITVPDLVYLFGWFNSLVLDASGNPVVSYYQALDGSLKLLHCNEGDCTPPDSVATLEGRNPGAGVSLQLSASGYPVLSYLDTARDNLVLVHCNDVNCAGIDESMTVPDPSGNAAYGETSLALDASGNPVVSYTTNTLQILHCNDPNCSGGDESITAPDSSSDASTRYSSLLLDDLGRPVVSYKEGPTGRLKILHCNDANCALPASITTPDPSIVVRDTSLKLDASGNPVVAYRDSTNQGHVKVLHCDDPNCSLLGESITAPDTTIDVGDFLSLALDPAGNPVVSYRNSVTTDLLLLHCDDPNCSGPETITSPDTVGFFTSLAIDAAGNPIIAYSNGGLTVMRCYDPNCAGNKSISAPGKGAGFFASMVLDANGNPAIAYNSGGDVNLLRCASPTCSPTDVDGDGCPDASEEQTASASELSGGRRSSKNPNDYFNPSHDGQNRVDDILLVVQAYFDDDDDGNPGLPPYAPGYNPHTDRTLVGPNAWNLGPPNGLQRIDDILNSVKQYFHDCG